MRVFLFSAIFESTHRQYSQSDVVTGAVNITCDAWQAANTDGYFAVTGHWIEETAPAVWECKSGYIIYLIFIIHVNAAVSLTSSISELKS